MISENQDYLNPSLQPLSLNLLSTKMIRFLNLEACLG